jgi:hypothetical protein
VSVTEEVAGRRRLGRLEPHLSGRVSVLTLVPCVIGDSTC